MAFLQMNLQGSSRNNMQSPYCCNNSSKNINTTQKRLHFGRLCSNEIFQIPSWNFNSDEDHNCCQI